MRFSENWRSRFFIILISATVVLIFLTNSTLRLKIATLDSDSYSSSSSDELLQLKEELTQLRKQVYNNTKCNSEKANVMLDLDDFKELTGPRKGPVDTTKNLVVLCIGKSDREGVNKIVSVLPPGPHFTYLLFHYDNSTWHEYSWYNSVNVVAIRVLHKMKFWYLKRFLTPSMAKAFAHIIILDADVEFVKPFDPLLYLKVADAFNISLSQPAHARGISKTEYNVLYQNTGNHIGRFTDFVECGPAVFLTSEGYQCIYNLLQIDLTSGWGLDQMWVGYMKKFCGFGDHSAAVMDAFRLIHAVRSGEGTASGLKGFNFRAGQEWQVFGSRFPTIQQYNKITKRRNEKFGFASCISTDHIAKSQNCSS